MEAPLDPSARRATLDAAQLLSELGHEVEEVEAPWGGQELFDAFIMAFGTPISMGMFFGGMVTGREPTEELVEPLSWAMWNAVREHTRSTTCSRRTQLSAVSRGIVALWETYDVILSPALAGRPVRIGEIDACSDDPWDDFKRSSEFTPYAAIYNVTGQPAITLPLFQGDDGLPTPYSSAAAQPARRACSASPRSWRRPARGPTAGPSWPRPSGPCNPRPSGDRGRRADGDGPVRPPASARRTRAASSPRRSTWAP